MYQFRVLLLFLTISLGVVNLSSIDFEDCGSQFYLDEVDIEGCTQVPCCLFVGEQHHVKMQISANLETVNLTQQVLLRLRTVYSGVEVTPDDPCPQIGCPISDSVDVSFSAIMNINSTLVPLDGDLFWKMYNEQNAMMLCMRTDIIVKDRSNDDDIDTVCK